MLEEDRKGIQGWEDTEEEEASSHQCILGALSSVKGVEQALQRGKFLSGDVCTMFKWTENTIAQMFLFN